MMKWGALVILLAAGFSSGAAIEVIHPYPGIDYHIETRENPPQRLFIAEVNLADPRVHARVARGGAVPEGSGQWQTTLMCPTVVAQWERFDLVVNGDFFKARGVQDAEGADSKFAPGLWAKVDGPAVSDGKSWSSSSDEMPCLVIHRDRTAAIELLARSQPEDWEVIAGNVMLVNDGRVVPHQSKKRNPRTAVGLDAHRSKLVILVVDGRDPDVATGMSYEEMAAEMLRLGCRQALNLDGGGSSVMAVRDPATEQLHILNHPSDGHERAVANTLGISVDGVPRLRRLSFK